MPSSEPAHRHNDYQRNYFSRPGRKPRMVQGTTPSVERHLDVSLEAVGARPGDRLLEVGCGMGRFTQLLAARGYRMTGADLSPELLAVARENDPQGRISYVCCDAGEVDSHVQGPFDGVVGFFFLHHLPALRPTFAAGARLLRPGGRVAFIEPNAFYPLFYLQILLTPGMSFEGDGGVARMRRGPFRRAWREAGLRDMSLDRYGLFPPFLANRSWGRRAESLLERATPGPARAFVCLSGVSPSEGDGAPGEPTR